MTIPFEVASGSVAGKDHRTGVPKNRQDDYCVMRSDNALVIVVSDGCGSGGLASQGNLWVRSGGSSEVGASIAVRLMSHGLMRMTSNGHTIDQAAIRRVQRDVEAQLRILAASMGPSLSEVVDRYFLFTLLGAVITPEHAVFFGLGDGLIMVNGEIVGADMLQADERNQPIYLGYALSGSSLTDHDPTLLDIRIVRVARAADIQHFLLATDGAYELIAHAGDSMPGLGQPVGPIDQFWQETRYFQNPAALTRSLNLAARDWNREVQPGQFVREGGLLHDDTTIVAGRRTTT
jgi:hypothetical protein